MGDNIMHCVYKTSEQLALEQIIGKKIKNALSDEV
jgi:hypothetical protein